jgi:hypothetical protein
MTATDVLFLMLYQRLESEADGEWQTCGLEKELTVAYTNIPAADSINNECVIFTNRNVLVLI